MLLHVHPKGGRDHVDFPFTKGVIGAVAAMRDYVLRLVIAIQIFAGLYRNDRYPCRSAAPAIEHLQQNPRCVRTQRRKRIHKLGSKPTSGGAV